MSNAYTVRTGDTFSTIAAKIYGDDQQGGKVARANPGVTEPLTPGNTITVPQAPDTLTSTAGGPDETVISVNNARYRFWEEVTINMAADSVPTIELTSPWDHTNTQQRDAFRPFSYQPVTITVGDELLFTGTMVSPVPEVDESSSIINAAAYAIPGVLGDCTAPASAYPDAVEFNDVSLSNIASTLAGFFGISVSVDVDTGAKFDRVALAPSNTIMDFLAQLAGQRKAMLSATAEGELLIWKETTDTDPVAALREGESPLVDVLPLFNPQQHYSSVSGIEPVVVGLKGSTYTVKNAALTSAGIQRPHTYSVQDTIGGDMAGAVETKAARMYGSSVVFEVEVSTWRDANGEIWKPNTMLTMAAPSAMVYSDYKFLIRRVQLRQTQGEQVATLSLVLPGSFSGDIPEVMPWDF